MTENLVFRNDELINETTENFKRSIPLYQAVINQFKDLNIGEITNRDELETAIMQPDQFLLQKMTDHIKNSDQPTFGGFKMQPEKLLEMLDLKEKSEFLQACNQAKYWIGYFVEIGTVKKNKVEADPKRIEAFIKKNTILAITDKERATFAGMLRVKEGMQILYDAGAIHRDGWNQYTSTIVEKSDAGVFSINVPVFVQWAK